MAYFVDHAVRRKMAETIRHLASGRITNFEFERRIPATDETALEDIRWRGVWPLHDDVIRHRLVGKRALTPEGRKWVSRIVLFLRSGQAYRYPPRTLSRGLVPLFALLTLGWFGRYYERRWPGPGDRSVWPFFSRQDYEAALGNPVYLGGTSKKVGVAIGEA